MDDTNLTINDLENMKSLIEVANSRGAFKASELQDVGMLYNKLTNFCRQMSAVQTANESATPPSSNTETQGE